MDEFFTIAYATNAKTRKTTEKKISGDIKTAKRKIIEKYPGDGIADLSHDSMLVFSKKGTIEFFFKQFRK